MIPDCDLEYVDSAGNAAGTGARIALLDATSRATVEQLVRNVEKVETAIEPKFQVHFVEAMAIPHKTASYPNLSKVVTLPASKPSASQNETRGRRPRRSEAPSPRLRTSRAARPARSRPAVSADQNSTQSPLRQAGPRLRCRGETYVTAADPSEVKYRPRCACTRAQAAPFSGAWSRTES